MKNIYIIIPLFIVACLTASTPSISQKDDEGKKSIYNKLKILNDQYEGFARDMYFSFQEGYFINQSGVKISDSIVKAESLKTLEESKKLFTNDFYLSCSNFVSKQKEKELYNFGSILLRNSEGLDLKSFYEKPCSEAEVMKRIYLDNAKGCYFYKVKKYLVMGDQFDNDSSLEKEILVIKFKNTEISDIYIEKAIK